MTSFFDEVAESVIEKFKKHISKVGSVRLISEERLNEMLAEAAKLGAEGALSVVPEHEPTMEWVCGVCREAIVAVDIDENHSKWVHVHDQ